MHKSFLYVNLLYVKPTWKHVKYSTDIHVYMDIGFTVLFAQRHYGPIAKHNLTGF